MIYFGSIIKKVGTKKPNGGQNQDEFFKAQSIFMQIN
jgi:hypothetical protein